MKKLLKVRRTGISRGEAKYDYYVQRGFTLRQASLLGLHMNGSHIQKGKRFHFSVPDVWPEVCNY